MSYATQPQTSYPAQQTTAGYPAQHMPSGNPYAQQQPQYGSPYQIPNQHQHLQPPPQQPQQQFAAHHYEASSYPMKSVAPSHDATQHQYPGYPSKEAVPMPAPQQQVQQATIVHDNKTSTGDGVVCGIPLYGEDLPGAPGKFVAYGSQDRWAALLFVAIVVGTCVVGAAQQAYWTKNEDDGVRLVASDEQLYAPYAGLFALGLGFVSLMMMRAFPKQYIYVACAVSCGLSVASALAVLASGQFIIGSVLLLFALFTVIWFWFIRHMIPFAAVLLKTAAMISIKYYGVIIVALSSMTVTAVFLAMWGMAVTPVLGRLQDQQYQNGGYLIAYFFLILVLFWVMQVAANVVHVTASGVFATWFFVGAERCPASPTWANFKRAMTTSFGTICFGSLVVAFLKTVYHFLHQGIRYIDNEVARCVLECFLNIIERLTEFFNIYAFTYVAVYGTDFVTSSSRVWTLMKTCSWPILINDSVVWTVLGITDAVLCLFIGVILGFVAKDPALGMVAALIAGMVLTVFFRPVYSCVAAQFVCAAENPTVMDQVNPEYATELRATMPPLNLPAPGRQQHNSAFAI